MSDDTQKPSARDLQDAIEHVSDFSDQPLALRDFNLSFLGVLSVDDLRQYDDIDAWLDLDSAGFEGMDTTEKLNALNTFRGKAWAQRAAQWIAQGSIPPVVVVTTSDITTIGDGRGRVNIANALGLRVPTWELKQKGLQELNMKKSELVKLIQECVAEALKEDYDRGDVEMHNSAKLDQATKEADQTIESLRALAKALRRKQDINMLQAFNQSLGGFVQKVTKAVK
jgi:hypothetical protein